MELPTPGLPNLKIGILPEAVEHNRTIFEENKLNLRQVINKKCAENNEIRFRIPANTDIGKGNEGA